MRRLFPLAGVLLLAGCVPTFETPSTTQSPVAVLPFLEIATPFTHAWEEPSHPFTGAAVLDVEGDGQLVLFVGGGRGQADQLLAYRDGALVDVIEGRGLSASGPATYGAASTDLDQDGDVDLIVARDDGVTVYVNTEGRFESRPLDVALGDSHTVIVSVAVSDIDADGDGDLYLSAFVTFSAFKSATFNDVAHAKKNILLRNDGGFAFTDITDAAGVAGKQNTFHTTFADLDGDRDQDMILSQNTGEVEIFENTGDAQFRDRPTNSGFGFWMGLAVGDIDADGDQDIFISNIGTSIPDWLTDGDLTEDQRQNTAWGLFRNDGDFNFTDIAAAQGLNGYGFAWGAQFEDLNLDGEADLLVAQNYIKWPLHKLAPLDGASLLKISTAPEGQGFYKVPGLGLENPYFGQSPIIVDLDSDGRADVVWLNMDGPLRAFLNRSNGNFLTVKIPDTVEMLGATVSVTTDDGTTQSRQVIASTGLMTDPTPDVHFGLGQTAPVKVEVTTASGERLEILNPGVNRVVTFPAAQ